MARKKKIKSQRVDPEYFGRQKNFLKRNIRKVVFFNAREMAFIEEYRKRYKIASTSAMIRQAVMRSVLEQLDMNPPTLF